MRAHGLYDVDKKANGKAKIEGKALTKREPVTLKLWERHLSGKQGIGIVPINDEGLSFFGAIDIDKYDIEIKDVEARCAALGLPLLPTRTKSGGVHLYLFTVVSGLSAQLVRARLEEWAVALGFGGVEIFPKQNQLMNESDVGNWINMPYFNAAETNRYGIFKGEKLSIEQYITRAEALRVTEEQLQQLTIPETDGFEKGPPCLQALGRSGFGEGQRNKGMFACGVYLKKRYPDDWQAHFHAYNVKYMRPPLADSETKVLIKSLARKEYNYTCNQDPLKPLCNRRICHTRDYGVGKDENEDWGIVIDSEATRVETNPPYWILTINGTRVTVYSEHLLTQRKFQELCVEKIGHYPPPLPGEKWRAEVNRILSTAVSVEAPADSSPTGELQWLLQQFCTVYPQGETREEILTGKPFTEEGSVRFRAADFKKFLDAQHFRAFTGHKLYAELRAMGVEPKQVWIDKQNLLVWSVPVFQSTADTVIPPRVVDKGGM